MFIPILMAAMLVAIPTISVSGKSKLTHMNQNASNTSENLAYATFGGGCFWCIEAIFSRVRGVHSATSGYAGGYLANPTYEQVKSGTSGHAEVVQVAFDPAKVSYLQLLEVFFRVHDPTTLNRQGADVGTQYRSVVFYHDEEQRRQSNEVIARLDQEKVWDDSIVTEVSALETFYRAEDYHQNFFERNPNQGYCQVVIMPKVQKFKSLFEDLLK